MQAPRPNPPTPQDPVFPRAGSALRLRLELFPAKWLSGPKKNSGKLSATHFPLFLFQIVAAPVRASLIQGDAGMKVLSVWLTVSWEFGVTTSAPLPPKLLTWLFLIPTTPPLPAG